jgi:hypothetical protein
MTFEDRLEEMAAKGITVTIMYHSESDKWICLWQHARGLFKGESQNVAEDAVNECYENYRAGKSMKD